MKAVLRRFAVAAALAFVGVYAFIALRGPQGVPALMDKRNEIRQLEDQNATLAVENQRKRDRIRRLKESPSEQEMEIRKQLKLLRPGETIFILPDGTTKPAETGRPSLPPAP